MKYFELRNEKQHFPSPLFCMSTNLSSFLTITSLVLCMFYTHQRHSQCVVHKFLCKFIFHQFDCVSFTAQKKVKMWEKITSILFIPHLFIFFIAVHKKESRKLIKFTCHAFGFDKKRQNFSSSFFFLEKLIDQVIFNCGTKSLVCKNFC